MRESLRRESARTEGRVRARARATETAREACGRERESQWVGSEREKGVRGWKAHGEIGEEIGRRGQRAFANTQAKANLVWNDAPVRRFGCSATRVGVLPHRLTKDRCTAQHHTPPKRRSPTAVAPRQQVKCYAKRCRRRGTPAKSGKVALLDEREHRMTAHADLHAKSGSAETVEQRGLSK
eukprot:691052-Pleurochrysis_carterae.AAC.9